MIKLIISCYLLWIRLHERNFSRAKALLPSSTHAPASLLTAHRIFLNCASLYNFKNVQEISTVRAVKSAVWRIKHKSFTWTLILNLTFREYNDHWCRLCLYTRNGFCFKLNSNIHSLYINIYIHVYALCVSYNKWNFQLKSLQLPQRFKKNEIPL